MKMSSQVDPTISAVVQASEDVGRVGGTGQTESRGRHKSGVGSEMPNTTGSAGNACPSRSILDENDFKKRSIHQAADI
jgi:hypothetical protein